MARDWQIVAIPTLIKEFPMPMQRFIGNFSSMSRLLDDTVIAPRGDLAI
jgi:hypothetical protein